ncbi:MAG: phage holin family protein [Butyrivibrio sp.]|nr:phage holin family protein [Butyrivibrio sp.]
MVTTVTLQPPFEYYWWFIIIGIVLFIGAAFLFILAMMKLRKINPPERNSNLPPIRKPARASLTSIKDRYEKQLKDLINSYANKQVSKREGYQRLSILIRGFVTDATGINVANYTKAEIHSYGLKNLDSLMDEYYVPEFAEEERAKNKDFLLSCNRTLKVIKSWR